MVIKDNSRKYFRVKLENPLCSQVTIYQVGNKRVNVGKKPVCIYDIGPGGLCFWSDLNFPVNPHLVLEFNINILNQNINLPAYIVRKHMITRNTYEYGVKFTAIDESDRKYLIKLFNNLILRIQSNSLAGSCFGCKLRNAQPYRTICSSVHSGFQTTNNVIKPVQTLEYSKTGI